MVAAVDRAGQQVWSPRKRGRESPVRSPWTNPSALDTRQTIVTGSIYGCEFYVLQSRSLLRYKIKRDFSPCSADGNILFRTIETNEIRSSNISSCTNFPYFIKNLIFPYSLNFLKFFFTSPNRLHFVAISYVSRYQINQILFFSNCLRFLNSSFLKVIAGVAVT